MKNIDHNLLGAKLCLSNIDSHIETSNIDSHPSSLSVWLGLRYRSPDVDDDEVEHEVPVVIPETDNEQQLIALSGLVYSAQFRVTQIVAPGQVGPLHRLISLCAY